MKNSKKAIIAIAILVLGLMAGSCAIDRKCAAYTHVKINTEAENV